MSDVTKLVTLEVDQDGNSEIVIDVERSQFSDGYSLVLNQADALRFCHAIIARVSDIRTTAPAIPLLVPTLQVAS